MIRPQLTPKIIGILTTRYAELMQEAAEADRRSHRMTEPEPAEMARDAASALYREANDIRDALREAGLLIDIGTPRQMELVA